MKSYITRYDELSIAYGEVINIHDKQEDGWWLGESNGKVGIFPATYVEQIWDQSWRNPTKSFVEQILSERSFLKSQS